MLNDKILTLNLPYSELFNTVKRRNRVRKARCFLLQKTFLPKHRSIDLGFPRQGQRICPGRRWHTIKSHLPAFKVKRCTIPYTRLIDPCGKAESIGGFLTGRNNCYTLRETT